MAELTKPAYSPNLRLNIPTARVSGSVPTSSSSRPINTGQKESHNAQMAKIAIDGISKLENAYDVAEMQQVRHEMNEEMTKMDKHFGDMTDNINNNLTSLNAKFLNPRDMEEGFNADGVTIGEHRLTPYEVSDDISEKAKELIGPEIELQNNNFYRKTQNTFTAELQRRSLVRIDNHTLKLKDKFKERMTIDTAEGNIGDKMFKPNQYGAAEDLVKNYDKFLSEELKYKAIDIPTKNLKLTQFKKDVVEMIFNRHVAQNPSDAVEQYQTGHKIVKNKDGEPVYISAYEVGGVSLDSSRVSNLMDAHMKTEHTKKENSARNAFRTRMLRFAKDNPDAVLHGLGIKKIDPVQVQKNLSRNIPNKMVTWTADTSKLNPEKWPHLDEALLEEIISTAVLKRDTLEDLQKKRNLSSLTIELSYGLGTELQAYRDGTKTKYYDFDRNQGGWRPKSNKVSELSAVYGLDSQIVESTMLNLIQPYSHIAVGAGLNLKDEADLIRDTLNWYRETTKFHQGKNEEQEAKSHPLKTEVGLSLQASMNADQRKELGRMVVALEDIKSLKKTYKTLPLPQLKARLTGLTKELTTKDNRYRKESELWAQVAPEIKRRMERMITEPVKVALEDTGNYQWAYNVHHRQPMVEGGGEDTIPKLEGNIVTKKIIKYMRDMGLWGTRFKEETFLPTNIFMESDASKHGVNEDETDHMLKALNPQYP